MQFVEQADASAANFADELYQHEITRVENRSMGAVYSAPIRICSELDELKAIVDLSMAVKPTTIVSHGDNRRHDGMVIGAYLLDSGRSFLGQRFSGVAERCVIVKYW